MKVALYVWLTVRCSFYFIDRATLLANEPFSLAWSFAELLEPPVSATVYVNCGSLATVNKDAYVTSYCILLGNREFSPIMNCTCSRHFTAFHHQLTIVGLICMKGHVWKSNATF